MQKSLKCDAQIVSTTSQNNKSTRLANENKKDEKYQKILLHCKTNFSLFRPRFIDPNRKKY